MDSNSFSKELPDPEPIVFPGDFVEKEGEAKRRGWIFDQILLVGQIEAAMEHIDEELCNIYTDLENIDDEEEIGRLVDKLSNLKKLVGELYNLRVKCMRDIFDSVPESDSHSWCLLKHTALVYAKAAENWHARKQAPEAESELVQAGKALAMVCSIAFNLDLMECLRCLDEQSSDLVKAVA